MNDELRSECASSNPRMRSAQHPCVVRVQRQVLALATTMTMIAGFVDAIGYVDLGQFYLSFMSGNTTRFGIALAAFDQGIVGRGAAIIATFVFGAFAGSLVASFAGAFRLSAVLGCEILCFCAAYALRLAGAGHFALLPIALAMGMQNAIHQVISGADAGKSFITGTLYGVGDALARAVTGKAHYDQAAVHAISWVAFAGGVTLGALFLSHFGIDSSLFIATVVLVIMTVAAFPRRAWFRLGNQNEARRMPESRP